MIESIYMGLHDELDFSITSDILFINVELFIEKQSCVGRHPFFYLVLPGFSNRTIGSVPSATERSRHHFCFALQCHHKRYHIVEVT